MKTILIGEGLLVGIVAGFVVLSYRLLLEVAQKLLNRVIAAGHRQPWVFALWFLALVLLAFVVSRLLRWEPLISGSGIPQLEGEMTGKLNQTWWKVLPAKFVGGFLCLLGGLSLGREGPSIQLGAMAGKAVSRAMDRGKTEENQKETLAQVFTDVRYTKKDNEFMSENLLKVLRRQGFMD